MASTRIRNGNLYYRKTVTDENGIRHWLEHSYPFPKERLPEKTIEAIFQRFPEPHTAFLPLYLVYTYGEDPYNVYGAKIGVYKDDKTVRRQVERIARCSIIFGYTTEHLIVDLKTGKPISPTQRYYISRVIHSEIDPDFTWEKFANSTKI